MSKKLATQHWTQLGAGLALASLLVAPARAVERSNLEAEFSVLDDRTARQKYGKEIAEQFFVIPVTVANKDERKVNLQFVRFTPPAPGPRIGTIPLDTVIQVYEKKKAKGKRARAQQILAWAALVVPSADFFFKNAVARSTFAKSLNGYNAVRTGAFEIFPEYLATYLQLLRGNKIFMKNFEVAPNSSDTVDVFVLKPDVPGVAPKDLTVTIKTKMGAIEVFSFAPKNDEVDVVRTPAP